MEITVLYFVDVFPYVFLSLVLAMAANRFASMSDEELQRKDHAFFGVVYASIFIKFNYNKFAG
jgi:hypothetical protein